MTRDDLQSQLSSAVAAAGITGASMALYDGATTHLAVAGRRNSMTGDPVTTDTLMHIGSITKVVTATLVMQLVDEGLIGLDDLVKRHLPDLKLRDMSALDTMTCKMLLNHTSGIDGEIIPDHGPDQERIEDAVHRFADHGQLHAPGGGPSYCNAGCVIAGHLVQTLRGASWYTVVKDRLLAPLGLSHALVDLADIPRFRVSVGDVTDPSTGAPVQTSRPFLPLSFAPAGATMMTTAEALLEFGRMHLNGGVGVNGARVLSDASARLMRTPTVTAIEPAFAGWGLGWSLTPGGLISHGGGGPGVMSFLWAHPESGRAVALLSNRDTGGALFTSMITPLLSAWTNGAFPPETPVSTAPVSIDPAIYLGVYGTSYQTVHVVPHDGGLAIRHAVSAAVYDNLSVELSPPLPLKALGDHVFAPRNPFPGLTQLRFAAPTEGGRCPLVGTNGRILVRKD